MCVFSSRAELQSFEVNFGHKRQWRYDDFEFSGLLLSSRTVCETVPMGANTIPGSHAVLRLDGFDKDGAHGA